MNLLPQLRQREVRDLYWACFSEELINSSLNVASYAEVETHFPHIETWFRKLDAEPKQLQLHLAKLHSSRLGLYFEALWEYYLRYAGVAELITKNEQVRDGKRTLGEYDFIYYCLRRNCYIHMEVAVKFYLGVFSDDSTDDGELSLQSNWIGPACKDRLDLKVDALFQRQLLLSQSKQGKLVLEKYNISQIERELCLKGMLFYPISAKRPMRSPQDHHPSHKRCQWLGFSDFCSQSDDSMKWSILKRRDWFSPCLVYDQHEVIKTSVLIEKLENHFLSAVSQPIQIVCLEGIKDCWQERGRYFITPDIWPK